MNPIDIRVRNAIMSQNTQLLESYIQRKVFCPWFKYTLDPVDRINRFRPSELGRISIRDQISEYEIRGYDTHGGTPMYLACRYTKKKTLEYLLEKLEGNACGRLEPEFFAALQIYKMTRPRSADFFTKQDPPSTRFMSDVSEILRMLLRRQIFYEKPMLGAISDGDCALVAEFMQSNSMYTDLRMFDENPFGFIRDSLPMVETLIRNGMSVNEIDNSEHENAALHAYLESMHKYPMFQSVSIVEMLLRHGADVAAKNIDGHTPFAIVTKFRHFQPQSDHPLGFSREEEDIRLRICELLWEYGAPSEPLKAPRRFWTYMTEEEIDQMYEWYDRVRKADTRRLAVGMSLHPRLGRDSRLSEIPELLGIIFQYLD